MKLIHKKNGQDNNPRPDHPETKYRKNVTGPFKNNLPLVPAPFSVKRSLAKELLSPSQTRFPLVRRSTQCCIYTVDS